ncbi:MAG: zincin-like metallopeptidase domain-containing protein [Planctomycetaceae bacterium]
MTKGTHKLRRDIFQEVTDRIIEYLEQGVVPWRNPIARGTGDGWPKNLSSGKRYRGINVLLLTMQSWSSGYSSDFWLTFKQARAAGGTVRKGEKGSLVTFWKMYDTKDKATGEEITVPVLKHYTAFNLEQIDGIAIPDVPAEHPEAVPFEPLQQCEAIVAGYVNGPQIEYGGSKAVYRPMCDTVTLPAPERFATREDFYGTLYHELSHSTGHSSRLDRGLDSSPAPFGSPDYSREELVAEISAAFLCAAAGISPPTIEQSAAYINNWIGVLKGDKRLVVSAAGAAQKSADRILGTTFDEAADGEAANASNTGTSGLPAEQRPLTTTATSDAVTAAATSDALDRSDGFENGASASSASTQLTLF